MYELRAKSTTETEMLMYGSISEWGKVRAEDFINKLAECKSKGYERIKLKINSPGGSIFEGLAMMSQMGTKEVYIVGVVEGIAASMASVMLQGCHKRIMVKGTRLMIHQGSGGVFGSANYIRDYADLLESLNNTMAEIFARRSKRDIDYIKKNWMPEGKDKWFTAEQALEEGLIDEIVEGNVKPLEKENATLMEMAAHYTQFTDTTQQDTMKEETKQKLIKKFSLKADATEDEIMAAVDSAELATEEKPKETAKNTDADAKKALVDNAVALAKERGLPDAKIEHFRKLAELDMSAAMALLPEKQEETKDNGKPLSVNELIASLKGSGSDNKATDRKEWKYADWEKNDPAGLLEKAKSKPEEFAAIFEASFGVKPSESDIKQLVI